MGRKIDFGKKSIGAHMSRPSVTPRQITRPKELGGRYCKIIDNSGSGELQTIGCGRRLHSRAR